MLGPRRRHFIQEGCFGNVRQSVDRGQQVRTQLVRDAIVQERSVLVQDKIVGISIELFKGQLRGIAVVNFVNGIGQDIPNLLGGRPIHGNVRPERLCLLLLLKMDMYSTIKAFNNHTDAHKEERRRGLCEIRVARRSDSCSTAWRR